jgi:uncharacterized protein (TIGR02391 family)
LLRFRTIIVGKLVKGDLMISSTIENAETLLAMEPAELAYVLLKYLASESSQTLHLGNAFNGPRIVHGYPTERHDEIKRALMESWIWLESEGLLAPRPEHDRNWVFITRRGQRLIETGDFAAYRRGGLLPKHQLHPLIVQKVHGSFLRGDYDVAVLLAFKQVEIEVRSASGLAPTDLGVALMRQAFAVPNGPLTDPSEMKAEQQALSDMFAGAIGYCKNPQSHRNVVLDPEHAAELIMFASFLLRIVDSRGPTA